jgi:hypothetical protein
MQPLKDESLLDSVNGKLLIFHRLRFQCSGEVTHLKLSLDDSKTELCGIAQGDSVRFGVSILERLDETNRYRFLSTSSFVVGAGEVLRQCKGQNAKRVDLELGYDGRGGLLVTPDLVIGLRYPITMDKMSFRETTEGNRTMAISALAQIQPNLLHVFSPGSVFQTNSNPRKTSIIFAKKSNFTAVPLIDVSIRASSADILSDDSTAPTDSQDSLMLIIIILVVVIGIVLNSFCLVMLLVFVCRRRAARKERPSRHYYSYPDLQFKAPKGPPTRMQPLVVNRGNQANDVNGPRPQPPPLPRSIPKPTNTVPADYMYVHRGKVEEGGDKGNTEETELDYL